MSIGNKLTTIAENMPKVHEAGKQAEYHRYWDNLQQNGKRRSYWGGFAGPGWNDEIFNPKYPFDDVADVGYMFYQSNITTCPRLCINTNRVLQLFTQAKQMRWVDAIVFLQEVTQFSNTFQSANALEHCPIESGVIAATVDVSACPFDKETIISWVNALSETKTGLTITFNLAAVNKAFETSEGLNDGGASVEWYELIQPKVNKGWTVELSM